MGRVPAAVLWLALVGAAVVAPPMRADLLAWLTALSTGAWSDLEPWVVAHFQLMGVWPLLFAILLRGDGTRSWVFRGGAFALGCFVLLPWFVWRDRPTVADPSPLWSGLAALGGVLAAALLVWATLTGDPTAWWAEARSEGFVWTMAFDFVAFWVLAVVEARARLRWWPLAFVPVVGLATALALEARR